MTTPDFPPSDYNPPVSILVTMQDGYLYVTPSRKVDRIYAIGLLHRAIDWVADEVAGDSVNPQKCFQQVAFTKFFQVGDYGSENDEDDDDGVPVP